MSVKRIIIPQQVWASGASGAALTHTLTLPVHGRCEQIEVKINNNTGNATLTLTVTSELSGTVYTKATIPENATTVYNANKATADFDAFLVDGKVTVTMVLSGDPSTSTAIIDVAFLLTHAKVL